MKTNIRNFRRLAFSIVVVILGQSISTAQPGGQQGPPPLPNNKQIKEMVADLSNELSLTPDQEVIISNVYFEHFEELETEMENNQRMGPQDMQESENELETAVKTELTKDQKKLYTTWLKKQEQERGSQRPQGGRQGPSR